MRNKLLKALSLCLLLALMAGLAVPGYAAAKPSIITSTLWAGVGKCALIVQNLPSDAKAFSVTSSRKDIVKAGCDDKADAGSLWIKPLKVGKSKITVKYTSGGKAKSVSATFTVKKYPNPLAWVKVNGKKVNLSKNKLGYDVNKYTKNSITIDYKLSNGWTVKTRTVARFKGDAIKDSSWKKNKAISLTGCDAAIVTLMLKNKVGDEFLYMVFVTR